MKFARIVFIAAGVWGIVVLTPLYFLVDVTGRQYAPPTDYPQFFYGFLSVAIAWHSRDRVEPGAIPALHAPGDCREARLRRDVDGAAQPGSHFSDGRLAGLARPAAGHPLHRRVCEDAHSDAVTMLTAGSYRMAITRRTNSSRSLTGPRNQSLETKSQYASGFGAATSVRAYSVE